MKNIIESIRATRRQKRKLKELKSRLLADYVEATPIPNIYKVVYGDKSGESFDIAKYNLYDAKENFYLFNRCKTSLHYLKYGLYWVQEYDKNNSIGHCAGIFDATANWFVFAKRPSLKIIQFPNSKTDTMLLQTNNELIVFNLKTKLVEHTIGI